jgi:hypothetical protein
MRIRPYAYAVSSLGDRIERMHVRTFLVGAALIGAALLAAFVLGWLAEGLVHGMG